MKQSIHVKEKITLTDKISIFKVVKLYYKKRPLILILNIAIVFTSSFIHPILSILIGLIVIFVLPPWKEKLTN